MRGPLRASCSCTQLLLEFTPGSHCFQTGIRTLPSALAGSQGCLYVVKSPASGTVGALSDFQLHGQIFGLLGELCALQRCPHSCASGGSPLTRTPCSHLTFCDGGVSRLAGESRSVRWRGLLRALRVTSPHTARALCWLPSLWASRSLLASCPPATLLGGAKEGLVAITVDAFRFLCEHPQLSDGFHEIGWILWVWGLLSLGQE